LAALGGSVPAHLAKKTIWLQSQHRNGTGCGRSALREWLWPAETAPMAKQNDYRNYTRDAVRLASHATSTAKKSLLLRWLTLQTRKISGPRLTTAS
jgi:hypothetical protein